MRPFGLPVVALGLLMAGCTTDPATSPDDTVPAAMAWATHADAPTPRTELAAAALGEDVYVIGGFVSRATVTTEVAFYDAEQDAWFDAPAYPIPVHHTAAVSYSTQTGRAGEGALYVLGGYTTSAFVPIALAFKYDAVAREWSAIAQLPAPRGAHAAAVVDGKIYVAGGVGADQQLVKEVHVYDPAADAWSTAPDLPTPRDHLAAAALDGTLYVVGGREQSLATNMGTLEAYDPATKKWDTRAAMPTKRGGITAQTYEGRIVVIGGESNEGTFAEVEAYNHENDTWSAFPNLPSPRHGLGSAVVGDRLYALLGGPEPGLTMSGKAESLGPVTDGR